MYLAVEPFAQGVHEALFDSRFDGDGQGEQDQQDEGDDAGNRSEGASGERHGGGNATIAPTVGAPLTGRNASTGRYARAVSNERRGCASRVSRLASGDT